MYYGASGLVLSPSDLSVFLGCPHRTGLDLAVEHGALARPDWSNPMAEALRERGREHEQRYLAWLRAQGLEVLDLTDHRDARAKALAAMRRGVPVIVQALLEEAGWRGYPDILRRVDAPSALGDWSYEAHDTKLARDTKGSTILQLSVYSEMLGAIQGAPPRQFHVVAPLPTGPGDGGPAGVLAAPNAAPSAEAVRLPVAAALGPQLDLFATIAEAAPAPFLISSYRVADTAAYYRMVKAQFLQSLSRGHVALQERHYPEPVEQCEICRWWQHCNARRRHDDHLGFIAGIGPTQRAEFRAHDVPTLTAAAALGHPLPFRPSRGSRETYERLRDQARVQHQQREAHAPVHELLPLQPGQGLARLPEPSPGDMFLDLEGARFAREGGREYLFGVWTAGEYHAWWAHDDAEEQAAFEAVMDLMARTWQTHPGMHVYHFGHYEASTFKRLMGRHATRADDLDRLLRGERLIDLYAVVRQALRAGVESYSIKQLERYYDFVRDVPLGDASHHLHAIELALESGAPATIPPEAREAVRGYNRDDCRSTEALRDWLERLRAGLAAAGTVVARPEVKAAEAPPAVGALEAQQEARRAALLEGLSPDAHRPGHADHARWLLAHLLGWHRREDKAQYWERYRLNDLSDEELLDERQAIAGLEFVGHVRDVLHKTTGKPTGGAVHRYRYPEQDVEIRRGKLLMAGPTAWGDIEAHDLAARTIDVQKTKKTAAVHPTAAFQADVVSTDAMQKSLLRLSEPSASVDTCGADLLHRRPPRLARGTLSALPGEPLDAHVARLALALDRTTLPVQGPPGSGKTYLGAQMIRALVAAGRRVGVVAPSHKVIVNLLEAVQAQARKSGERVAVGRKIGSDEDPAEASRSGLVAFDDNETARAAIAARDVHVLGGTAWLWAREEFAGAVDVLFVDEAGQLSLANALAVSSAAGSLVLLGDPQQLDQPQKGSHPDGVDVSALAHVLGDAATMPPDRGLFLPETWRLAPEVCAFTSELFYAGELRARAGLERQRLAGLGALDGAGVRWLPVPHDGNQNWSPEEVDVVTALVDRLLAPGGAWVDADGTSRAVRAEDILVVAPYNAHVNRLSDRLAARGVRVGTVDKFQGQEAPVVIYAMATSSPEDAPRGMEFLYSLNRLNVATSRARCAAFVVASPRLLQPHCRTPQQMQLANALCRYVEMSVDVTGPVTVTGP